jgi:hypothetical protein
MLTPFLARVNLLGKRLMKMGRRWNGERKGSILGLWATVGNTVIGVKEGADGVVLACYLLDFVSFH